MDTIGIIIPATSPLTKCVPALRPYMAFSISSLKEKIQNNDYVYECQYIDTDGVGVAIHIVEALARVGIEAQCFEHNRPCSIEFLQNWYQTGLEIHREVEEDDS